MLVGRGGQTVRDPLLQTTPLSKGWWVAVTQSLAKVKSAPGCTPGDAGLVDPQGP
jgi:hypothetical protein